MASNPPHTGPPNEAFELCRRTDPLKTGRREAALSIAQLPKEHLGAKDLEVKEMELLGWRPSLVVAKKLLGWRPLLLRWRPSLVGWRPLLVLVVARSYEY